MKLTDWVLAKYFQSSEHPGKLRVVRWLGRRVLPERGIRVTQPDGLRLYLHPRDWIEYLLLRGSEYEPLTLDFIRSNLASGDGAVFAGVNFGQHVAVAARAVGDTGLLIGVEPQPSALLRCRANLELNGLEQQVRLVSAALGAKQAMARMAWSDPDNAGAASLFDTGGGFSTVVIPIETVLSELGQRPLKLVLLDVQGFELEVLRGLEPATRPQILIVEIDQRFLLQAGVSADQIGELLRGRDYRLCNLFGEEVTQLDPLPENNVVALAPGIEPKWSSKTGHT